MKSKYILTVSVLFVIIFSISGCVDHQSSTYSESSSIKKPSAKECVKISDLNTQYDAIGYRVMGRLTNTCDENLDYVAYTITAYDKDGKIIDVLSDYHPCFDGDYGLDAGNSCTFKSVTIDSLDKYDIEISKARYR